jgi:hypothetical protein
VRFTTALVAGLVLGASFIALAAVAERSVGPGSIRPSWPGWVVLILGVAGAVALGLAMPAGIDNGVLMGTAIALPAAGFVLGIARLFASDRRWQVWLGLVLAAAPVVFWIVFVIGEFVSPH